jgi:hypothetical protein|tara:strand:- start:2380 stop:2511 length:132 start_codon:yes stop_codon:yes gene_type:complete
MEDYNEIVLEALKMYKNSIGENEVWQYDTINKIDKITEYLKNN